jgi:hypothetical protein
LLHIWNQIKANVIRARQLLISLFRFYCLDQDVIQYCLLPESELLEPIREISFSSGRFSIVVNGKRVNGGIATGLTGVRRSTALAIGLPDALAQCGLSGW